MTDYFDKQLNPKKLKDYLEKDLDYKDQVRNTLTEQLGYEPPLQVSILSEINLRTAFRHHALGQKTKNELESNILFHVNFIKRLMLDEVTSYNC